MKNENMLAAAVREPKASDLGQNLAIFCFLFKTQTMQTSSFGVNGEWRCTMGRISFFFGCFCKICPPLKVEGKTNYQVNRQVFKSAAGKTSVADQLPISSAYNKLLNLLLFVIVWWCHGKRTANMRCSNLSL